MSYCLASFFRILWLKNYSMTQSHLLPPTNQMSFFELPHFHYSMFSILRLNIFCLIERSASLRLISLKKQNTLVTILHQHWGTVWITLDLSWKFISLKFFFVVSKLDTPFSYTLTIPMYSAQIWIQPSNLEGEIKRSCHKRIFWHKPSL